MRIEQRLAELGLVLPAEPPEIAEFPRSFAWTRVRGDRVYIAGHGPLHPDGTPAGPFGRVPSEVSLAQAQEAARQTALAMLGSLQWVIGDLDRVTAWLSAKMRG